MLADAAFPSKTILLRMKENGVRYIFSASTNLYPSLAAVGQQTLAKGEWRAFQNHNHLFIMLEDNATVKIITNAYSTTELVDSSYVPTFPLEDAKALESLSEVFWQQQLVWMGHTDTSSSRLDIIKDITGWDLTQKPPTHELLEMRRATVATSYNGPHFTEDELKKKTKVQLVEIAETELKMTKTKLGNLNKAEIIKRILKRCNPEENNYRGYLESQKTEFLKNKEKISRKYPEPLGVYKKNFNLVDRFDEYLYLYLIDHHQRNEDWESYVRRFYGEVLQALDRGRFIFPHNVSSELYVHSEDTTIVRPCGARPFVLYLNSNSQFIRLSMGDFTLFFASNNERSLDAVLLVEFLDFLFDGTCWERCRTGEERKNSFVPAAEIQFTEAEVAENYGRDQGKKIMTITKDPVEKIGWLAMVLEDNLSLLDCARALLDIIWPRHRRWIPETLFQLSLTLCIYDQ